MQQSASDSQPTTNKPYHYAGLVLSSLTPTGTNLVRQYHRN